MSIKQWSDLEFWKSKEWEGLKLYLEHRRVYPARQDWFLAYLLTPLKNVRAVVLGQDPYHDGSAHGLAFSTVRHKTPPSLQNIFKEYENDLHFPRPRSGNLSAWAKRGVLLLNSSLTVAPDEASSHRGIGWESLVQETLATVLAKNRDAVFVLWGKEALETAGPVINGAHRVISSHPSPLSADRGTAPFMGSRPFTKVNALLVNSGQPAINWRLPS